ncbi:MAG TPA: hypothetical protein VE093_37070 [Polyangiaceae bacterium]|jgi:hypothetical protein|nr:hypothetical protein [Polyangiaceae bacterium]
MMAVNPTDWFTVVLTPGFTYGLFTSDVFGEAATRSIDGAMFRGSLGFQFRIGERFAIHPEISLLKSFEGAGTVINAGLGFNFGSIPGYKDLSEDPEMPERPRPGAPPPGAAPMSAPMPAPMPASAPMPAPAAAPPT